MIKQAESESAPSYLNLAAVTDRQKADATSRMNGAHEPRRRARCHAELAFLKRRKADCFDIGFDEICVASIRARLRK